MEQMTDFGWFLVGLAVFVVLAALLGLIKLASMATQWIEERPERAARAAEAINQAPGVSRFVSARAHVLSSEPPQPAPKLVSGTGINPVSIPPAAPDRDIVAALAAIKTVDGYRFSANAIYGFVRGNRNEVLAWVREVRGDEDVYLGLPPDPHIQVPAYEPPPVSAR